MTYSSEISLGVRLWDDKDSASPSRVVYCIVAKKNYLLLISLQLCIVHLGENR